MSNNSKQADQAASAPLITSGEIQKALVMLRDKFEIKGDSCSSEEYGALIFATLAELQILPKAKVTEAMMAWNFIPKNPSAMRQAIWKEEKTTTPKVSGLMAKYAAGE